MNVKQMTKKETHDPGPLERLFGATSATARVLDFLSTAYEYDYNKTDIAQGSNVSQKHVTKAINKLEQIELIKKTRTVGRSEMYQYNMKNKTAELLEKFSMSLATYECEKTTTEELKNQQPNTPIEA
jgi:predicted transcriptional regulator